MSEGGNILFIGAGKMATALAGGMVGKGYPAANIFAVDVSTAAIDGFRKATGIEQVYSQVNENVTGQVDMVVLAVKPQYLEEAVKAYCGRLSDKLVVSIAAGVSIGSLAAMTGADRVVRVMPNTPALVGYGAAGYAVSAQVTAADRQAVETMLKAVGLCRELPEKMLDAVTGLSGSGPAYVLEFIQALADGGVYCGLPRDVAVQLAAQTVAGAAIMALQTGEHPMVLRDQVISPAGTTGRGVAELDRHGFRAAVGAAVAAAAERSAELGKLK